MKMPRNQHNHALEPFWNQEPVNGSAHFRIVFHLVLEVPEASATIRPLPTFTMKKTRYVATFLLAFTLPIAAQSTKKTSVKKAPTDPLAVHQNAIVIDTHADTTQRLVDENYDLTDPLNGGNLNFESAKKGNLGAEFFSIWVEPDLYKGQYARRTLELIDAVYQQAAKHPDQMRRAYSAEDIVAAHREHKLAALMGIEGGHSIEDSLALLRDYYRLGG